MGKRRAENGKKPGPPAHDDKVKRDLRTDRPNELWLTDISEHPTGEGKPYLCAVKARLLQPGRRLLDQRPMKSRLAVDAVTNAVTRRAVEGAEVTGCVVHSDRGAQFRSRRSLAALRRHDLVGSMGQVGSAGDNAAMESFFGLLENNVLDRHHRATPQQPPIAIITWTERTYHRRRHQPRLRRLTPSSTRPS